MANSDGSPHGQIRLVITGNEITATNPQGGQVMGAGSYTISGSGKLCRIDAEGTSGQFAGKAYEGIFSVEGKTPEMVLRQRQPPFDPGGRTQDGSAGWAVPYGAGETGLIRQQGTIRTS